MIIIVIGLPGTGKTYFAKYFAKETGAVHLNTDVVREKLGFKGDYDEKTKQQVYNELFKQAKIELQKGADIIVDGTFHQKRRRKQFERLAAEMSQDIYFIQLKVDEKTAKKRVNKERKYSEAGPDVYDELKSGFEPVERDYLELKSEKPHNMTDKAKAYIYG